MQDDQFRPDVVAGKYDAKLFDETGKSLLVNEIFYTIQGEASNAGRAAIFIRMAKCNLACKFCDTEFEVGQHMAVGDIIEKVKSLAPPQTVDGWPAQFGVQPLVVLSGGEPGLQNCYDLVKRLEDAGWSVCLETSGSIWAPWMRMCSHICVSPKVPLNRIPPELQLAATEFKWIVNAAFLKQLELDPDKCYMRDTLNYLQPESQNPKWTAAALKLVMQQPHKYRLSLQTHKYIGAQ